MTITAEAIKPYLLSVLRRALQGVALTVTSRGWVTDKMWANILLGLASVGSVELAIWFNKLAEQYKLAAAKILPSTATDKELDAKVAELRKSAT